MRLATEEAKKVAPKSANRQIAKEHTKIAEEVKSEVAKMVLKDATKTARDLAVKEVQSQMHKSTEIKVVVAKEAKGAAKHFARKFSNKEIHKLVKAEAKKQVKNKVDHHAKAEMHKAEKAAMKQVRAAQGLHAEKCGKPPSKPAKEV